MTITTKAFHPPLRNAESRLFMINSIYFYPIPISLSKESNVEIQTTERLIEETKPAGVWNVDQDLNNEGVKYIAIY